MDMAPLVKEQFCLIVGGRVEQLTALLNVVPAWREVAGERIGGQMEAVRLRLGEVPTELHDDFGAEFSLLDSTQRDLYASLAVHVASAVEGVFNSICWRYKLPLSEKATWGEKRQAVEKHLKLDCAKLPGIKAATEARVLGNCFKHGGGRVSEEAVKVLGGKSGDLIPYEKYNWGAVIGGVEEFLYALVSHL